MTQNPARTWVWRSTEVSRAAGLVSVLAVAETLACVALYWLLWLWLGVTWHHWFILIATPLVLLRSEQSLAKGIEWFEPYFDRLYEAKPTVAKRVAVFGLSAVPAFWLALGAADLPDYVSNWALFWTMILLVLIISYDALSATIWVAIIVALKFFILGAEAVMDSIVGPVMDAIKGNSAAAAALAGAAAGAAMGALFVGSEFLGKVWLRATVTRCAVTVRYLWPGLRQLPRNWRFSILVSDIWHAPELIPGDPKFSYGGKLSLAFKRDDGSRRPLLDWVFDFIGSIVFFLPTMLWRWAIKSTAWFYIPLLWSRRGWLSLDGDELRNWANTYSRKVWNWFWLISGGLSIAFVSALMFSVEKWMALQQTTSSAGAPMGFIGFIWSLNWLELLTMPWLWFLVPSYFLTITIFFTLDSIAAEVCDIKDNHRDPALLIPREAKIVRWKWVANARTVLTNIGLLVALWYFLGAVDAWEQMQDFFAR